MVHLSWQVMSRVAVRFRITLLLLAAGPGGSAIALDYERDVMPIFEVKCFKCHSVREGKPKGGLRLDDLDHFRGRFAKDELVTPGNPKLSGLYYSLTRPRYEDGAMPPEGKGEPLTVEEVERVRAWIADGARVGKDRSARGKPPVATPAPPRPVERDWTNRDGKTIRASLLGIEGGMAILRLPNGVVYRYPVSQLSDESRLLLPAGGPH